MNEDIEPTDEPPEDAPAEPKTFFLPTGGGIRPTGRFVGQKKPGDPTSGESLRVADSSAPITAAAADVLPAGEVTFSLEGRPRQNEEGTFDVCQILIRRLNAGDTGWSDLMDLTGTPSKLERGADCSCQHDGERLDIQVTRAESGELGTLGRQRSAQRTYAHADEAALALRVAIENKVSRIGQADRHGIILALDATDSVAPVLRPVVAAFRANHAAWVQSLGFRAVWLVGPLETLTFPLDR